MFLKNSWYVAGYASEIGRVPLARTILGLPIVLYRTEAGLPVALEDRCCHRGLPLSLGKIEGDAVRCGYHGLKYDATGACIEVPGQKAIPPGAQVRRFPTAERWHFVWIWMGDAARADAALLPDWHVIDDPRQAIILGNGEKPLPMRCNWELNNDNLLDLSHVFFVHSNTLGGSGPNLYPIKTVRSQRGVRMSRWTPRTPPTPIFAHYLNYTGEVDRWQATDAEPATHCAIDAGFCPVGTLDAEDLDGRDRYIRFRAFITATPETEASSFMFYVQARNFAVDSADLSQRLVGDFVRVFGEDIAVMEAQQRATAAQPDAPMIDIAVDAPCLAMRRLVRQLAAAEA